MSQLRDRSIFDVVVVGAGHAGCEAALACVRRGLQVCLLTANLDRVGWLSCNPAVGGVGKGHLVRELDLLGGEMGRVADVATLHSRTLNASKGPAVRATRAQVDMFAYARRITAVIEACPGLTLRQGLAQDICHDDRGVTGVVTVLGQELHARALVVTTGTFLRALLHVGQHQRSGGRDGDAAADGLSASLARLGLTLGRLKTGTCPRLDARSIDFSRLQEQAPEPHTRPFSVDSPPHDRAQLPCHLAHTGPRTHDIIRGALDRSPLFSGQIEGRGPRYCPSIEDKVVRFASRDRHLLFIEPEGRDSPEVYPSGLSTSLPAAVQIELVHSIAGLERAHIRRWGYAVEYDYVLPTQLWPSLECKALPGLFLAGQINGTSGYEEAAAQGLMAGINAAHKLQGREPLVLRRDQAYIGVMIDDLVTRGTDEPYRMFTSRAEHRLLLREDNVAPRLLDRAREAGLRSEASLQTLARRVEHRRELAERFEQHELRPGTELNQALDAIASAPLASAHKIAQLMRRPEVDVAFLQKQIPELATIDARLLDEVITDLRYQGYIVHAEQEQARTRALEQRRIPHDFCYAELASLSAEAREHLERVRPRSLGQAGRIPGITSAALNCLAVALLRRERGGTAS